MTITYRIANNIYINLTNRCSNSCDFCIRNGGNFCGYSLWLEREPETEEIIAELKNLDDVNEIVFCGYGEPFYRLDTLLAVADYAHSQGKKTRINTNGHGALIAGKDAASRLKGKIDTVSISLNASDAKKYQDVCHSEFGESAYAALIDFGKECLQYVPNVVFSVVDVIGKEEIEKCRLIAKSAGVAFRVREAL